MFVYYNPNPLGRIVGDCVIRAICKVTNQSWSQAYRDLCDRGLALYDMPSSDEVWGSYLKQFGFRKYIVPDSCPDCYSLREFCKDHAEGIYVIKTDGHVTAAIDGVYFDSWDSGDRVPIYFWRAM